MTKWGMVVAVGALLPGASHAFLGFQTKAGNTPQIERRFPVHPKVNPSRPAQLTRGLTSSQKTTDPKELLETRTGENWEVLHDPVTARPILLISSGVTLVSMSERESRQLLIDASKRFLSENQKLLGLSDIDLRLEAGRTRLVGDGRWVVDFQQVYRGLAVKGSSLTMMVQDGRLTQIRSHLFPPAAPCDEPCDAISLSDGNGLLFYPLQERAGRFQYRLVRREVSKTPNVRQSEVQYRDVATGKVVEDYSPVYELIGKVQGLVHERGPWKEAVVKPLPHLSFFHLSNNVAQTNEGGLFNLPWKRLPDRIELSLTGDALSAVMCGTQCASRMIGIQIGWFNNILPGLRNLTVDLVDKMPRVRLPWRTFRTTTPAERDVVYHVGTVRDEVLKHIDTPWLHQPVVTIVNGRATDDTACNAFFAFGALHFFNAGTVRNEKNEPQFQCANTGEFSDIIYHEWGHGLYMDLLGDDLAREDPAANEATGDIIAFHMTGDAQVGRNLFTKGMENENFVRDVSARRSDGLPPYFPANAPEGGDPHLESLIFTGAMWDLRKELMSKHGAEKGNHLSLRLFLRALKVSQVYTEFSDALFFVDDDDANLLNGTPHRHEIQKSFGMRCLLSRSEENAPHCKNPAETQSLKTLRVMEPKYLTRG